MVTLQAVRNPRPMAPLRWARLGLVLISLLLLLLAWPPGALGLEAASGASLFENHCSGCHLQGGNIIRRGKTLKLAALQRQGITSPEAVATIAAAGVGQMGGYGDVLGAEGVERVAAWVWQQAEAGWPRS